MEANTSLASGIEATKDNADYDAACKRLLSEKIILAWIMKSCLEEYRDMDANEIARKYIEGTPYVSQVPVSPDATAPRIRGLSQEQSSPTEGSVYFDIYFHAILPGTGEVVQMIINVEAQSDFYPGYPLPKRGIFYCGRMISSQDGTVFFNSHYEKLQKVCSVWVCTNPPEYLKNTINSYQITEKNLVGKAQIKKEHYDMLSLVMICLGKPDEAGSDGVLKLLSVLLSSEVAPAKKKQILQDEFQIPMTQTLDREVSLMCNLSQSVEARGIEKGEARGIEKGEARGIKKGIMTSLKNLMESMNLTIEEAMNALGIPDTERQYYRSQLTQ